MGRILALDFGTKRIGVALSDESKKIAFMADYVSTDQKQKLIELLQEKKVEKIILGLPKNLAGNETKSAEAVRDFGDWLEDETKLPIEYIDERLTTKELSKQGIPREELDSAVAQHMLQRYLDSKF